MSKPMVHLSPSAVLTLWMLGVTLALADGILPNRFVDFGARRKALDEGNAAQADAPTIPPPGQPPRVPRSLPRTPRFPRTPRSPLSTRPPRSPAGPTAPPPVSQKSIPDNDRESLPGGNCPDDHAILTQSNIYRIRHQAPELIWDEELAAESTKYGQKLVEQSCSSYHSGGKDYGENLMMVQQLPRPGNSCMIAIKSWYAEVKNYDFGTYQAFSRNWPRNVGHFTQQVWKSTTRIGCGVGTADLPMQVAGRTYIGGCKIIVCRYRTFGNVGLDVAFLRNVLPNISEIVV